MQKTGLFGESILMNIRQKKLVWVTSTLLIALFIAGCAEPLGTTGKMGKLTAEIDLGTTIGSVAEVFSFDSTPVEGYALVDGLMGRGSAKCPLEVKVYLEKYIRQVSPKTNVDAAISSRDTAVVFVQGLMPAAVSKNQRFDIKMVALDSTTSLKGGTLLGVDLFQIGRIGISLKPLAKAEGPVFIDTVGSGKTDKKIGYVLAGGRVLDEYKVNVLLRKPDFKMANSIRNRLNDGRFGPDAGKAISYGLIEVKVPAKYRGQKQRFVSLVKATYLVERTDVTKNRIMTFARKLAVSEDKEDSEIALEAIGRESLAKLAVLLKSSNEEVRLRAARCMLNLGSYEGIDDLREIAMNQGSAYRVEALEAITAGANRHDAAAIAQQLLRDEDFEIRLAGYENLRKSDNIAITQRVIGGKFYLEQIAQSKKAIFVSRSDLPRIVLFGAPLYCQENLFVVSDDGSITINSLPGSKHVSIIRKLRGFSPIRMKSSFELGDIIRALCEEMSNTERPGLNVSYAEMIAILKQLCDKGAIKELKAEDFRAGPLPKI